MRKKSKIDKRKIRAGRKCPRCGTKLVTGRHRLGKRAIKEFQHSKKVKKHGLHAICPHCGIAWFKENIV